jgi:hypothetical protein
MRPAGSARGTYAANDLALPHKVAFFDQQFRCVQKCTVQTHAMVDHQQMTLQSEDIIGGKGYYAVGWRDEILALGGGDVHAIMIAARRAVIDALRAK